MFYGLGDIAIQRSFIENSNAPENQKRIERQKLNYLLGLCEATSCRRQILLEYFGDRCEPCNNCDTCINKPEIFDGTILAQKAISCVYRTNQMFGIMYLIDVLMGVDNQRIKNFRHDKISVYGIGKEFSKQEWLNIFRQLVSRNLLMVDMIGHGALKITDRGMQFLKEKENIELGKYTKRSKIKIKKEYKTDTQDQTKLLKIETQKEKDLLALLKSKRLEIAKAQKVPPYVVFHDKTLVEMIKTKPRSIDDMSEITGIGEAKIRRCGQVFLNILLSHFN